ncbi:hypothetical protein OG568_56530 (plasmid) [Streptomyces sp. NBC_01450]|uniref:hypothetical protein n=1 Tax=Streptomyces sp. NBC_01450 TaxID=2903871 RepID=UPI002E3731CE|nr:hypothetical protein [Streptomyces sp. NBC_01450]
MGLLEQRELAGRRRVDELPEEVDRIQAELVVAEEEWEEWAVARSRVGEVLALTVGTGQDHAPAVPTPSEATTVKPKSQVPMWSEGLVFSALWVDYQRILKALTDRHRLGQGPLTCQEMADLFGLDAVPARVEALRSKAKRLILCGRLAEAAPGRSTLASGVSGSGGGS